MEEEIVRSGTVEDMIFQNRENGYAVFSLLDENEEDETVCVGILPQLHKGESVQVVGNWVVHPSYGKQLQVTHFMKTTPTTEAGMVKYLGSGIIRGIGPKTAKKIVERFGEATFYVIEEKPDRLVEIKGITYDKAMSIHQVFQEQHQLRQAMMFLQEYDISPAYAMKIYKKYKERTYEIVKSNPYRLADDIVGIGFTMADRLAAATGISPESPHRLKSGVQFVLNREAGNGHVYLPKEELLNAAAELLGVHPGMIDNILLDLQMEHKIWQEKREDDIAVYLAPYYHAEVASAKKLLELSETVGDIDEETLQKKVAAATEGLGIQLAASQLEAVREAMVSGLLVLTGGPGTGKTTTINTMIRLLMAEGKEIALAAPTGRAAKRMTEATGQEAQTIHRLLGINFVAEDSRRQTFDKNEDDPIEADVVIIDEASMVDILLLHSLLRAIAPGTKLILVGDVDQLPSVGPGNVLKDIIASGCLKVVCLTEIFRQAQESAIIMNAHRINHGEMPVLNAKGTDFFFLRRGYQEDVVSTVVDLITRRLPAFSNRDSLRDMQVLTPMRKSLIGVQNLNVVLQRALNPPSPDKTEHTFRGNVLRVGDKVMQIKNNYNLSWETRDEYGHRLDEGVGVFNGDQGVVSRIDEDNEMVTVLFDGERRVQYDFTQLDELELAYAITIHKSQGSEYPVVILPVHSGPPMLLSRNLLYTGVTRAKELVVLVGMESTIEKMVENDREVRRYTGLAHRLSAIHQFLSQV